METSNSKQIDLNGDNLSAGHRYMDDNVWKITKTQFPRTTSLKEKIVQQFRDASDLQDKIINHLEEFD